MRRFGLILGLAACGFSGHGQPDDVVDVDAAAIDAAVVIVDGDPAIDAPPDGMVAVLPVSCRDVAGGTGTHPIQPIGSAPFDVYCEQSLDAGGWTLIASFVNDDGARHWSTEGAMEDGVVFGTLAAYTTADYKSPAYAAVSGADLLVITPEYSFSFHSILSGKSLAKFLVDEWPNACATAWTKVGADFAQSLSTNQRDTLGVVIRGRDMNEPSEKCFPVGDEVAALSFVAGADENNGVGNGNNGVWGMLDESLPKLASFPTVSCTGGYPCGGGRSKTFTAYDASVKAQRVELFVR